MDIGDIMDNRFRRQINLLNPTEIRTTIHLFGLGTIGSFTALNLVKMGIKDLVLYDYDTIEEHNVSNQLYTQSHIGLAKTESLMRVLEQLSPQSVFIRTKNERITEETQLDINRDDIVVLAFDNMESRQIAFNKIIYSNCFLIDSRMGGETFRVFSLHTGNTDRLNKFAESLNPKRIVDIPCGEMSISYNSFAIASIICSIIKKMINKEDYPYEVAISLKNYDVSVEND